MKKALLFFVFLLVPSFLFAGGGFYSSFQGSEFSFNPELETPNLNSGYRMIGGFGYSVSQFGWVSGGFGAGIVNDKESDIGILGGIGGTIGGYQLIHRPIHIAIMTYTAFGGMSVNSPAVDGTFFVASFEADVEVGLPLTSWFMPVVFAGYRATGNIAPGDAFETFVSYGPVMGVRFTFGH